MKRSVNLFLILLIVLAVSVIGGLTLYYQEHYQAVTQNLTTSTTNLTSCQLNLKQTQQELATTKIAVTANKEDVEKTVGLFEQKQGELADTNQVLNETRAKVKSLEYTITLKDKQIGLLGQNITNLQTQNNLLRVTIASLNTEINDLNDQLDTCG